MGKISRVSLFVFSILLLSNNSFSDELELHNNGTSVETMSYQDYLNFSKWQNEQKKRNNGNSKQNTTVLVGGVGLACSYVATVVTGLAISSSWNYKVYSYYLIPVIGPFLQLPGTGSPYTELCVLSGVAQTAFLGVLVYGLIKKKKPPNDSQFQIICTPIFSKSATGISLGLQF